MRRGTMRGLVLAAVPFLNPALPPPVPPAPVQATVCEVMKKPSRFNGKLVRITAQVKVDLEFGGLTEGNCEAIWFDLPDEPNIRPRPRFKLIRNETYKRFEELLKPGQSVIATVIGRIDGVDQIKRWTEVGDRHRDKDGSESVVVGHRSNGFGHMGQYRARIVIWRIERVEPGPKVGSFYDPQIR